MTEASVAAVDFGTFLVFVLAGVLVVRWVRGWMSGRRMEGSKRRRVVGVGGEEGMVVGRVARLAVYPIKSCRPVWVSRRPIGPLGLAMDRMVMLVRPEVDADGLYPFVSQRNCSALCAIHVTLLPPGPPPASSSAEIILASHPAISRPLPIDLSAPPGETVVCRIWNDEVECSLIGPEADEWFSEAAGEPLMAVRVGKTFVRPYSEKYRVPGRGDFLERSSLADGFPHLLTSNRSLKEVSSAAGEEIEMERFRPNIVIDGPDLEPWAEDDFAEMRIGKATFWNVKLCQRCKIPRINLTEPHQEHAHGQPTKALTDLGRTVGHQPGKDAVFGVNLTHAMASEGMVIEVGDVVEVRSKWAESLWPNGDEV